MSSVNIDLAADTILNVMVGQQDENEVREVVFDFSDWYTTYGSGTISLAIQRPKDEWPYEGTLTVDNSTHKATWEISDTDSAYAGVGQIQLSYTVGTAVKKSVVYRFTVHKSLGAMGNVITPIQIQTFIDEVTEALEDMQEELNDVKQDLAELEGGGVPTNVRQALKTLLESAAYADTGLTDEMAVVSSWASAVTTITLNQSSISISGATTSQLVATTTPTGGTVTWSSSNIAVATVSSSGLVTGVSNGTATITATSGNVSATCSVTVSGIATLSSISASYTQTGTIYDTDDLDDILTAGSLVVTATYSDSSTATVASTDYTLSGTLTVGTSTITVSYGGKTTTFTVTVSEQGALYPLTDGTFALDSGSVTISNGNHIKIEYPEAVSQSNLFINFKDQLYASVATYVLNNRSEWFVIPSGKEVIFDISNVTNDTGLTWQMNFRKSNATTSASFGTDNLTTSGTTVTNTLSADESVSCLFLYTTSKSISAGTALEFDVSLTVDGVSYI